MGYEVEVPVQRPRIEQMESRIRSPRRLEPTGQRVAPVNKTVVVPNTSFVPRNDTMLWQFLAGYLRPNAVATQLSVEASVYLPVGVTLQSFEFRLYRNAVGDAAQGTINRVALDGTSTTLLATLTGDVGGWSTKVHNLSELSDGLSMYVLGCSLTASSSVTDSRLGWVKITYSSPQTLVTI